MNKKEKSPLARSFVTGVIAAVFLLVGYQTSLFIHRAAVLKIAANRDEPDTVYIYMEPQVQPDGVQMSAPKTVRANAEHSAQVEAVRSNLPRKKVESFHFNPNTASIDELCRLGFSVKQAQSIDNYRLKGGRFSRKSDFADSYVVSDSIYRRLEPFIDIPLVDLNEADSAAFDALPGIGGWFAAKIIEHREALGGYSHPEQLMDIYRFDREKYDALSDLVTVSKPYKFPLWDLPADSLRRHPYIKNYQTARSIVFFREHNPDTMWTIEALSSAGIITQETALRLSRCL